MGEKPTFEPAAEKPGHKGVLDEDRKKLGALSKSIDQEAPIDIAQFVRDFPDQLPGAGKIEKYPVEGAKKCIVVLGKCHLVPVLMAPPEKYREVLKPAFDAMVKDIDTTQEENRLTLEELIKKYGIRSIRLESIFPSTMQEITDDIAECKKLGKRKAELQKQEEEIKKAEKERGKETAPVDTLTALNRVFENRRIHNELLACEAEEYGLQESLRFVFGGAYKLIMDGRLSCKPAETDGVYRRSNEMSKRGEDPDGPAAKEFHEFREDESLKLSVGAPESIIVMEWGNGHVWDDGNVQRWNNDNPTEKYASIRITPQRLVDIGDFEAYTRKLIEDAIQQYRESFQKKAEKSEK